MEGLNRKAPARRTVRLREATLEDTDAIVDVHVRTWRETYADILPRDGADPYSRDERTEMWGSFLERAQRYDQLGARVVETPAEGVVGVVCMGPTRTPEIGFDGELYAIYLLPEHQGEGRGRRLFNAAVEFLQGADFSSMMLWVYVANDRARGFYEGLGGEVVTSRDKKVSGEDVEQVAYGWDPIERSKPEGEPEP